MEDDMNGPIRKAGTVVEISGPMFSGKSTELIEIMSRCSQYAGQKVVIFKPSSDTRSSTGLVESRTGTKLPALTIPAENPAMLISALRSFEAKEGRCDVIGIDEAQFFPRDSFVLEAINSFANDGYRVIVAGLKTNFRGEPFGAMPDIIAIADRHILKYATCVVCGSPEATYNQRMKDGKAYTSSSGQVIEVGGEESYQARCRNCFQFP